MIELDKHRLTFDRPHVYGCTCGYQVSMFVIEGALVEKITSEPAEKIKYLLCGHAECCKTISNGKEVCFLCLVAQL